MQELEGDNAELQSINEDLVKELELRDVAVKEAVDLICQLEAKVESMETQHAAATPTRRPRNSVPLASSPPRLSDARSKSPPQSSNEDRPFPLTQRGLPQAYPDLSLPEPSKSARRAPSFLREDQPSTSALRSLYRTETNASHISLDRAGSPQKDQDPDTYTLNSPRLSMLSESSFMSVYGKTSKVSPDSMPPMPALDIARIRSPIDHRAARSPHPAPVRGHSDASNRRRQDQASRSASGQVSNDNSDARSEKSFLSRVEQSTKTKRRSSSHSRDERLSQWLDESASADEASPLRHRSHRHQSPKPRRSSPKPPPQDQFSSIGEVLHKPPPNAMSNLSPLPTLKRPIFTGPEVLPPTPDTMSTVQNANSSTQSIITEKSLNDISRLPAKDLLPTPSHKRSHTKDSLGLDFENDISSSDEEQRSVHVERSEAETSTVPPDAFDSFPFMGTGSQSKAKRMLGDKRSPTRPPLATNMMFDGDGYASRALSYPSPKAENRRSSIATTPTRPEPARGLTTHAPLSPKDWISKGGPANASPPAPTTSRSPQSQAAASASPSQDVSGGPSLAEQQQQPESKLPKTTSSRLKTLFRRSYSQSGQVILNSSGANPGAAAPVERESKIARPGTAGAGAGARGGLGRSASTKVFGGREAELANVSIMCIDRERERGGGAV